MQFFCHTIVKIQYPHIWIFDPIGSTPVGHKEAE